MTRLCECGRPARFVSKSKRAKRGHHADNSHTLCRQCFQAQRNRHRCPYCGIRSVNNAGKSCTECEDMLCNCDPGSE